MTLCNLSDYNYNYVTLTMYVHYRNDKCKRYLRNSFEPIEMGVQSGGRHGKGWLPFKPRTQSPIVTRREAGNEGRKVANQFSHRYWLNDWLPIMPKVPKQKRWRSRSAYSVGSIVCFFTNFFLAILHLELRGAHICGDCGNLYI